MESLLQNRGHGFLHVSPAVVRWMEEITDFRAEVLFTKVPQADGADQAGGVFGDETPRDIFAGRFVRMDFANVFQRFVGRGHRRPVEIPDHDRIGPQEEDFRGVGFLESPQAQARGFKRGEWREGGGEHIVRGFLSRVW